MYREGRRSGEMGAVNMANLIGKKLYRMDDSRVNADSDEKVFRPKDY